MTATKKTLKIAINLRTLSALGLLSGLMLLGHACSDSVMPFGEDERILGPQSNDSQFDPNNNTRAQRELDSMVLNVANESTQMSQKIFIQALDERKNIEVQKMLLMEVFLIKNLSTAAQSDCSEKETPLIVLVRFIAAQDPSLAQDFRSQTTACLQSIDESGTLYDILTTTLRPLFDNSPTLNLSMQRKHAATAEQALEHMWFGDITELGTFEGFDKRTNTISSSGDLK